MNEREGLPGDQGPEPDQPEPADLDRLEDEMSHHEDNGLDLARSIARGLAGNTGPRRRRTLGSGSVSRRRRDAAPSGSGAHPDERDPQTLDVSLGRLVADQGWRDELRVHGVFSRWQALVGREVGQHATPESYAEGRLVVRTDSTAWATQIRLLAAELIRRINSELGEQTVQVIEVRGPDTPSWSRGRFRVKGRGPRDTYG